MAVRGLTTWSKSTQALQGVAPNRNTKVDKAWQIYENRKATHRDEVENAWAVLARFGVFSSFAFLWIFSAAAFFVNLCMGELCSGPVA